jgi:glycosyltransferase involved in cell wall biosynthesis
MQAGTLVVTSNTSCLPEIAGPSSICVDPNQDQTIADGLEQALNFSPEERARRLKQGREWSQKFSWQNSAKEYLRLYEEMLAT